MSLRQWCKAVPTAAPPSPQPGAPSQSMVGGQAWAQHTGIERVQLRLDGKGWTDAELGASAGADTWVQWVATFDVAPGDQLAIRATDRSGYTQTAVRVDVVPDGATGWHVVEFSAI